MRDLEFQRKRTFHVEVVWEAMGSKLESEQLYFRNKAGE